MKEVNEEEEAEDENGEETSQKSVGASDEEEQEENDVGQDGDDDEEDQPELPSGLTGNSLNGSIWSGSERAHRDWMLSFSESLHRKRNGQNHTNNRQYKQYPVFKLYIHCKHLSFLEQC